MKASDCKCIICGKQAVAFWPCIDPDIPSHPYCRECLDKTKMRMLIDMQEPSKGNKKLPKPFDKVKLHPSNMETITTNVKLFMSPDKKKILYAVFDGKLVGAKKGDPQRAKHYVYKDPDSECYVHYVHYLVPDDVPPRDEPGLFVSERVFFGKYRVVEQVDRHLPETWATVGDIVDKMEENRRRTSNTDNQR